MIVHVIQSLDHRPSRIAGMVHAGIRRTRIANHQGAKGHVILVGGWGGYERVFRALGSFQDPKGFIQAS